MKPKEERDKGKRDETHERLGRLEVDETSVVEVGPVVDRSGGSSCKGTKVCRVSVSNKRRRGRTLELTREKELSEFGNDLVGFDLDVGVHLRRWRREGSD